MKKHTPGPWIVSSLLSGSENHRGFRIFDGANAWALATVQPGDEDGDLGRANAHLIAAAPDLLFQLLAASNYIDALGGDSKSYRAAIADATGEQA